MPESAITPPPLDPTPIFDLARGNFTTEFLGAAVGHFRVFELLAEGPLGFTELAQRLGLAERAANVLLTALRAMGLLGRDEQGRLHLTPLAREHLLPGQPFDVSGYVHLASGGPGTAQLVERLRTNQPAAAKPNEGAAFIYRAGIESAMDEADSARRLTLALAGRAKVVAPYLARQIDLAGVRCLLDVAGGTGLYAIACVQALPGLRAIVFDRPEVLKICAEYAERHGVADRIDCVAGDMFSDPLPPADAVLLSNVLHDWDVPTCEQLLARCVALLPPGGAVHVHDVFLDDDLGGPLPIALYSAALFSLTEGRAYSAAEYRAMLTRVGLVPEPTIRPTLVHCGILTGRKPA